MASDDPVVAVPMACLAEGACHRSAKIETPRANINKWIIPRQVTFGKLTTCVENLYICIMQHKGWETPENITEHLRVAGYSSVSEWPAPKDVSVRETPM